MPIAYTPDLFPRGRINTPGEDTLKLEVTFGAAALASAVGKDMALVRNSAGNYSVQLPRTYRKLTGFRHGWKLYAAGAVFFPVILTNNIATTGVIIFETRTEVGAATDPATGNVLGLEFDVTLDGLNDGYAATTT